MNGHVDVDALDRYLRRAASPEELLAIDAHLASCDRCHAAVASAAGSIRLPPPEGEPHLTYDELEAFVDGRADDVERELVEGHAALCDLCRRELTDLQRVRDAMRPKPRTSGRAVRDPNRRTP